MRNSLLFCIVLLAMLSSCAPKYGAHFQATPGQSYARQDDQPQKQQSIVEKSTPDPVLTKTMALLANDEELSPSQALVSRSEAEMKHLQLPQFTEEDQLLKEIKARIAAMTAKEKRALKHQIKAAVSEYKTKHAVAEAEAPQQADTDLLLLVIITILLPPLGMFLYEGDITSRFWISLLLTLLFYVPGLIYTLVVILGEK